MKFNIRSLINFLAALIVFSDAYSSSELFSYFELRGSYFILPLILLLSILVLGRLYFNKNFIVIFGIITFFSIYSVFVEKSTVIFVSKVVVSVLINSLTFYMVFKINDYDVKPVIFIYLNFAFIISLIGIAQELNNITNLLPEFGATLPLKGIPLYRVTSVFPEPAHYCEAMIPAFYISLVSVIQRTELIGRWKSWIIIIAFVLTFSTVGYFGILISIILVLINYKKIKYLLIAAIIVPFMVLIAYFNVKDIRMRVDGTFNVITGTTRLVDTNWSTFSLISNWEVGFISFIDNPVFGGGFGSHPVSYRKYIPVVLGKDVKKLKEGVSIMPLNVEDAASLFNRLLSETGIFGLIAFLFFVIRGYLLKSEDKTNLLWIINNAILVFFLIKLIRGGHYFIYGVFFFFWAYYFSKFQADLLSFKLKPSQEV